MKDWFKSEADLSKWLVGVLKEQGFHAQSFEEVGNGVPDLNAGGHGEEVWVELKLSKRMQYIHSYLRLDHPLQANQYGWLSERSKAGRAKCLVVVAWRTTAGQYISFVPIAQWKGRLNQTMAAWVFRASTVPVAHLGDGHCRALDLIQNDGGI